MIEALKFTLMVYLLNHRMLEEIRKRGSIIKKLVRANSNGNRGTIKFMPLLLNGALKVKREDDECVIELLLYFCFEKGDTCGHELFSCCMGDKKSGHKGSRGNRYRILMIPVGLFGDFGWGK